MTWKTRGNWLDENRLMKNQKPGFSWSTKYNEAQYISQIYSFIITTCNQLEQELTAVHQNERLNSFRERFAIQVGEAFAYEFSDGDLEQIQTAINELRELVTASTIFEEQHRLRLLTRLEKLQQELHKKMSNVDQFWGLFADIGINLGKFGKEAKPFVELIERILKPIYRTQARAEELPSDANHPMLEPPEE